MLGVSTHGAAAGAFVEAFVGLLGGEREAARAEERLGSPHVCRGSDGEMSSSSIDAAGFATSLKMYMAG